jgi:hypothetical protein
MGKIYAGFDTYRYPGDALMKSLWDHSNLYWVGFYLGPNYNFTPHYGTLASMGWGIAPIYMGKQIGGPALAAVPKDKKYSNGAQDGLTAVKYAKQAGMRPVTTLYFDIESPRHDRDWIEYFAGWCRAVVDSGYGAGCYCSYLLAPWLMSQLTTRKGFDTVLPTVWAFNIDKANPHGSIRRDSHGQQIPWAWLSPDYPEVHPNGSGYSSASSWQRAHGYGLEWEDGVLAGKPVKKRIFPADLDTSIFRDPGNPARTFAED